MNEQELRNLMFTATQHNGPFSIRYPRGKGVMSDWRKPLELIELGTGRALKEGDELAFLTIGHIGNYAEQACERLENEGIKAGLYDMRFVKPLDEKLLHHIGQKYTHVITVEDGCLMGGFGSAILEFMADHQYSPKVVRMGIPDSVVEHGDQLELHRECGFDPDGIYQQAVKLLEAEMA
jgi:1-deoxy-D-xylulose-5-phosphate synthase